MIGSCRGISLYSNMSARLHRIGTIYSRIDGLIRKGQMKESEKPIWFDVYRNFPPKYVPTYKRTAPSTPLRVILYKEDVLRAKIHKTLERKIGLIDLNDSRQLFCESLLKTCQQYISEGLTEDEAIEKLKNIVQDTAKVPEENQEEDIIELERTLSEIL